MTAIDGFIKDHDEREYRELLKSFVDWCETNGLGLNACKNKDYCSIVIICKCLWIKVSAK